MIQKSNNFVNCLDCQKSKDIVSEYMCHEVALGSEVSWSGTLVKCCLCVLQSYRRGGAYRKDRLSPPVSPVRVSDSETSELDLELDMGGMTSK